MYTIYIGMLNFKKSIGLNDVRTIFDNRNEKNQKMMIFKKNCLDFFLSNHNVPFELEILSMYFAV